MLQVKPDRMKKFSRGMTSYASIFGFMRGLSNGAGQE